MAPVAICIAETQPNGDAALMVRPEIGIATTRIVHSLPEARIFLVMIFPAHGNLSAGSQTDLVRLTEGLDTIIPRLLKNANLLFSVLIVGVG